jgi:hypothetical protein
VSSPSIETEALRVKNTIISIERKNKYSNSIGAEFKSFQTCQRTNFGRDCRESIVDKVKINETSE